MLPFLDHTSEAFASDPYGTLRAAREASWIVETPTGLGVLTYAACNAVITDPGFRPRVFELMQRAGSGGTRVDAGRTLLGSEGVDHQELRRVVSPWFTPRRINTLRVQTANFARELVSSVSAAGTAEFMADVARRIPPTVFCWMVGCDLDRGPELAATSAVALQAFSGDPSVMGDVVASIRVLRRFADELIEEKRERPGDDITSALVLAIDDGLLTERDARSLLTELLSASVDNTTTAMGLALWLLCLHPDQCARLVTERALMERAVEECARFEPSIRHGNHVNDEEIDLLGYRVPAGTLMTVYLAAAHRDPDVFADPDRFDVTRQLPQPQLTFGLGRHYCIGAALARMEVQETLRAVVTTWREPRLLPGVDVETTLTGEVRALPLEFRAAI